MTDEIWRDITGYEGLYQVSTLGRVRSLDMVVNFYPMERKPYTQIRKGRILKQINHVKGYKYVWLHKDGEAKFERVHRLVAKTFLKNPQNYDFVKFKDGNKHNVKLENLKWASRSSIYKKAHEKTEVNMKDIFVDEIDKQLIYYYRNNFKTKQMAEKTGLDLNTVRNKLARLRKHGKLKRWWEE